MELPDLVAAFVKELNAFLGSANNNDIYLDAEILLKRISEIKVRVSTSEKRAVELLKKVTNQEYDMPCEPIYIRSNNRLLGIVSDTIGKFKVPPTDYTLAESCTCLKHQFQPLIQPSTYTYVETEEELLELDKQLNEVCLQVFDHKYRSYNGFACFITLCLHNGHLYIIDALKFRETIPRLRLLRCGVHKLIHCQNCVTRLFIDFGIMGCYQNYCKQTEKKYIDWRIRPINDIFISLMFEGMAEIINSQSNDLSTVKFIPEDVDLFDDFVERYGLIDATNFDILRQLIQLREYLSHNSDEGNQYVMTDKQLLRLFLDLPSSTLEFERTLNRLSPIARRHINDFLIVLQKRSNGFSLSKLMGNKEYIFTEE